jgi:HPt (histidine-containing phosphotransfer) domain-containing protein
VKSSVLKAEPADGAADAGFEARVLRDRFDGDLDLLREVASVFLECTPPLLDELRDAVAARDSEAVSRLAHRLRGSLANFGAEDTVEVAFRLEKMGVDGELAGADEAFERLTAGYQALRAGVDRLLPPAATA